RVEHRGGSGRAAFNLPDLVPAPVLVDALRLDSRGLDRERRTLLTAAPKQRVVQPPPDTLPSVRLFDAVVEQQEGPARPLTRDLTGQRLNQARPALRVRGPGEAISEPHQLVPDPGHRDPVARVLD